MFTIYHSNQIDILKSLVGELMKRQPLDDIFTPEVIIVQSQGMAQWLQIELAKELSIAANIEFPFPNQFIETLYQHLLPDTQTANRFNMEAMTWQLFNLLPHVLDEPIFSVLKHYLKVDYQERKLYQLATRIASLFDQYLVYRPDWIAAWESGKTVLDLDNDSSQIWQAELWRRLIFSYQPYHRANIYQNIKEALLHNHVEPRCWLNLPKRIFIFGIVSLPPIYLDLLQALGQHIDVHLMFNNPCKWYWGDIFDKQLATINSNKTPNPLLTSWGKLGRDNLFLLQDFTNKREIDAFADYGRTCLLHSIQQDILELYQDDHHKHAISSQDNSISLHVCHSEQREVEVLYDHLLSLFDQDPHLELRDCVVMVSDIDRYVPYIQAVFGNASGNRYLPFTISDQKARNIDPIVQGFLAILNFPQSRFTSEELFNLLEIPAIADKFLINESQLLLLRKWIVESGIRFGLESSHGWLSGLERLLLGYMMSGEAGDWQNILAYDSATGLDAELIGQLAEFIAVVRKWFALLSAPKSLQEWQGYGIALLDDFFVTHQQNQSVLLLLEQEWQNVINGALITTVSRHVSITVLHDALQTRLESNHLSHHFLIGKINFCTMMPMRSIPFKVVCLLGMNDGVYPRTLLPLDFDLIAKQPRRGDRSRRNDDRYLFLEAILSAEQQLYISYIGRDIKDNSERYPSILVDELWEYMVQYCNADSSDPSDSINILNKLKKMHTRTPFNPQNFLEEPRSYADEWLPAAAKQGKRQLFKSDIISVVIENINLDDLKRFYEHSIRFFLQKRLNFYVKYLDDSLPDAENFNLNDLERYQLNQKILQELILSDTDKQKQGNFYKKLSLSGVLPDGSFGEIIYEEQQQIIQPLAEKVNHERLDTLAQEVNITIAGHVLQGWLTHVQDDGILKWRAAKLSIRDAITLWIDHLIYCLLNPNKLLSQSRIYGRDEQEWRFSYIEADKSLMLLTTLVDGYLQGINTPLLLPIKSAWEWLTEAYDKETGDIYATKKAYDRLLNKWLGGFHHSPECDDYYFRLYPELNDDEIEQIMNNAKRFLLPILQYCDKDK